MLQIFYQSVVASEVLFAAVSWGGSIRASDANKLKLNRKAGSLLETSLEQVVESSMLHKLLNFMENSSNSLRILLVKQRNSFSRRLLQLRCVKERYSKLFLPTAIT